MKRFRSWVYQWIMSVCLAVAVHAGRKIGLKLLVRVESDQGQASILNQIYGSGSPN